MNQRKHKTHHLLHDMIKETRILYPKSSLLLLGQSWVESTTLCIGLCAMIVMTQCYADRCRVVCKRDKISLCHTAKYKAFIKGGLEKPLFQDIMTHGHIQIANDAGEESTSTPTDTDLTRREEMVLVIGVVDLPASYQSSMQPADLSSELY